MRGVEPFPEAGERSLERRNRLPCLVITTFCLRQTGGREQSVKLLRADTPGIEQVERVTGNLAIKGALAEPVLEQLEAAREIAETTQRKQMATIGPARQRFLVQPHGQRGGYRYVLTNGPTGAIFAVKANPDPEEWNLFISVRAACLLTKGYEGTKQLLSDTIIGMGGMIRDHSVNRLDYAVDILATDFTLDMADFVTPGHAKVSAHWESGHSIGDNGEPIQPVMRGGRFETVTIGKMPGRQVILYDKRRAAIDKKELHWFEEWGVDRSDPGQQVWRVEIRAGKKALEKGHIKRSFEAIDADFAGFLRKAMEEIRYVTGKQDHSNVSRAATHPLWQTAADALQRLPVTAAPAPTRGARSGPHAQAAPQHEHPADLRQPHQWACARRSAEGADRGAIP